MEQQPIAAEGSEKARSGLAVASLVLGILGIVTCLGPVFGIPGLILGIIALGRTGKSGGEAGGHGIAVAGTVTSGIAIVMIVFVAIMAGMLLPALSRAREEARKAVCKGKLKVIGVSCFMYAADNEDKFPEKLSDLFPKYIDEISVFVCKTAKEIITNADEIDVKSSYIMVPGVSPTANPAGTVLVYEKEGIHIGGLTVLFADGHVEWVDKERLKVLLAAPAQAP